MESSLSNSSELLLPIASTSMSTSTFSSISTSALPTTMPLPINPPLNTMTNLDTNINDELKPINDITITELHDRVRNDQSIYKMLKTKKIKIEGKSDAEEKIDDWWNSLSDTLTSSQEGSGELVPLTSPGVKLEGSEEILLTDALASSQGESRVLATSSRGGSGGLVPLTSSGVRLEGSEEIPLTDALASSQGESRGLATSSRGGSGGLVPLTSTHSSSAQPLDQRLKNVFCISCEKLVNSYFAIAMDNESFHICISCNIDAKKEEGKKQKQKEQTRQMNADVDRIINEQRELCFKAEEEKKISNMENGISRETGSETKGEIRNLPYVVRQVGFQLSENQDNPKRMAGLDSLEKLDKTIRNPTYLNPGGSGGQAPLLNSVPLMQGGLGGQAPLLDSVRLMQGGSVEQATLMNSVRLMQGGSGGQAPLVDSVRLMQSRCADIRLDLGKFSTDAKFTTTVNDISSLVHNLQSRLEILEYLVDPIKGLS